MSYIWMFVLQRSFLWPDSYTGIFLGHATANEYKKAVIWLSGHNIKEDFSHHLFFLKEKKAHAYVKFFRKK